MRCPYCRGSDSKVIDSRELPEGSSIRRRRLCVVCGMRYTTYERVETAALTIVKKDGRREEYNRQKLFDGLRKACAKRPISGEQIEDVVDRIESELLRGGESEIPSEAVGELVMAELRELDEVAYIRFASVYRAFQDLETMRQELDALARR